MYSCESGLSSARSMLDNYSKCERWKKVTEGDTPERRKKTEEERRKTREEITTLEIKLSVLSI